MIQDTATLPSMTPAVVRFPSCLANLVMKQLTLKRRPSLPTTYPSSPSTSASKWGQHGRIFAATSWTRQPIAIHGTSKNLVTAVKNKHALQIFCTFSTLSVPISSHGLPACRASFSYTETDQSAYIRFHSRTHFLLPTKPNRSHLLARPLVCELPPNASA